MAAMPDTLGENLDVAQEALQKTDISGIIEKIIRQRIQDLAFDDVVRKVEAPPAARAPEENAEETLDFQKSRVGLGEIYSRQYEAELLGHKAETEEDKSKQELARLFAKLVHQLDSLTNQHFVPRPPKHGDGHNRDIAAITVEDTVPVTMSDAQRKAPEEVKAPEPEKASHEMSREERKALRGAKKRRRKQAVKGKLGEGRMTLHEAIDRQQKLTDKNKQAKEDRLSKRAIGLTGSEAEREKRRAQKRIKSTDLLAQASASFNAEYEQRKKRQKKG